MRQSGRKLILVTGRDLDHLLAIFPRPDLFEWIVAENGGVLYCPRTRESQALTESVPQIFPDELRRRGVTNVSVGNTIVATWHPHECTVLEVLRDLGLDRQIIFNKGAVMVLPTGVNKASGLSAALEEMEISHHNVVALGDAENDLPMLVGCECGVAMANALDSGGVDRRIAEGRPRGSALFCYTAGNFARQSKERIAAHRLASKSRTVGARGRSFRQRQIDDNYRDSGANGGCSLPVLSVRSRGRL